MMYAVNGVMLALGSSLVTLLVVKATFITSAGLIAARSAGRSRAAVRHALMAASFAALMALPVATLLVPPVRIALAQASATPSRQTGAVDTTVTYGLARTSAGRTFSTPRRPLPPLHDLLLMGWFAGTALLLVRMITGLWQVHVLRKFGIPWRAGQSLVERMAPEAGIHRHVQVVLHESAPVPVTCGVIRPAIVLPCDAQGWAGEDLNRALTHELEHVRRRDWVSHCLARAVCATYWFHPLVWIASRQLELEAERSCDDAVLRFSEATVYADQLVGLAQRLSATRKSPAPAMANRSDLSERVAALLNSQQARGKAGSILLAVVCTAAAIAVLTISPIRMVAAPQTASDQSPAPAPEFEAVSIKLIDPNSQGLHWHERSDAKYLNITGSIHGFILRTYGIRDAQLSGEPDWFTTRLYTIEAVTSAPTTEKQKMLALRGVLADRFHLRLRQENRDLPILALEVAPKGPKFGELKPGEAPAEHQPDPGNYGRTFTSIQDLMNQLNGAFGSLAIADRPVADRTRLTGRYDIYLETQRQGQDDAGSPVSFPNLLRDLQSELGLRLVAQRGSMPCFVVEHAEAPTSN